MNVKPNSLQTLLTMPVHPMAARFPMWSADRLEELAADIKANGLNIPLVVWKKENMLLDGRNRLAACKLANIEPRVEQYDGDDPRALIISRNIQTREMTASQKAMLLAVEYPEAKHGGARTKGIASLESELGFSPALMSQARTIVRWAGDEVDGVIAGLPFQPALRKAENNRTNASAATARMERLEAAASDLALQVREGTLSLSEAEGAWQARQKQIRDVRTFSVQAMGDLKAIPGKIQTILAGLQFDEPLSVTRADLEDIKAALSRLDAYGNGID